MDTYTRAYHIAVLQKMHWETISDSMIDAIWKTLGGATVFAPKAYEDLTESIIHLEKNRKLAYEDLRDADGYEAMGYLDNMNVWLASAADVLAIDLEEDEEETE